MSIILSNPELARRIRVLVKALDLAGFRHITCDLNEHNLFDIYDYGGAGVDTETLHEINVNGGPTLFTALETLLRQISLSTDFHCFDDYAYNGVIRLRLYVEANRYVIEEHYEQLTEADDTFWEDDDIPAREETVDEEQ